MDYMKILIFLIVNIFMDIFISAGEIDIHHLSHRSKRQLLFPNSTLLQFNAGIGTPSIAKDINMNFAFQANFQLPWNITQIPADILHANSGYDGDARKKRGVGDYENDAKLFHFYKYVEELLYGFGYDGKACVRQALCKIGAEPLHSDKEDDLLHDLASFVLNPTNDADNKVAKQDESYPYITAYKQGQKSQNCMQIYNKCKMSFADIFSRLHIVT